MSLAPTRALAVLTVVTGLAACVSRASLEYVPPDDVVPSMAGCVDEHDICTRTIPRPLVYAWPVEDRALEIWARRGEEMYTRPFAGDMILVLGSDEPGQFTWADRRDLATTRLGPRALWRRAIRNADAYASRAELTQYDDGNIWVDCDGPSANTLVLSPKFWARPEFKAFAGPPMVVFAQRSYFRVIDSGRPNALETIRDYAESGDGCGREDDYPKFCSRAGYVFIRSDDGRWSVADGP